MGLKHVIKRYVKRATVLDNLRFNNYFKGIPFPLTIKVTFGIMILFQIKYGFEDVYIFLKF